ncbi:IucA/IucC family protein [Streptomyces sp. RPT161]|uniref:IucA/IucC family protein n=1 Tax=Streptomyces sp. RPT161 TaxID=3015993 RepID=UPI0022B86681|nr:IucA/IucC family protein [Streptomyces sp. RPT161]
MTAEDQLTLRVLSALLREDVVGLRRRSTPVARPDGRWLRLPAADGGALLLAVAEDGYQCEYAARLPLLRQESAEGRTAELTRFADILGALRALAEPVDRPGFDAFAEEYRQTLATMRLHDEVRAATHRRLAAEHGPDPAHWRGHRGALAHDTLAAYLDHPVYPTARGRRGLGAAELRVCAPEFHPRYRPRWLVLPREAVSVGGAAPEEVLPGRWPSPALLGMPERDRDHLALPVHPLTKARSIQEALRAVGLDRDAVLARRPHLDLVPTLSMRTGALADHPRAHLKLPLDTATLGVANLRTIKPGTLGDGAECQRLLEAVTAREPRFADTVLLADETCWAHAGHPLLAALVRVHPAGLDQSAVVPMAALLATAPSGRLVIDHLADRFHGGDPLTLLDAVLRLLFDWQTTLFGYGIALESHQQNISLVFDADRVRLLLKDNDGPRINAVRLGDRLGPYAFDDPRITTEDDGPLADLFTTITVHLCAGAYAFALARTGRVPLVAALRMIRARMAEAVDRLPHGPREVLRERVLDAERLPVKAMVSAGTLFAKARSGATDINKHYTSGPNYLLGA